MRKASTMLALTISTIPRGRFVNGEPERIGDPTYRRFRGCEVDPQRAPKQGFAIEVTEHDIGVADGRLCAAGAIGGRARIGAGALWADLQSPLPHRPRRCCLRRR
jgi:hypothetical protein